MVNLAVALDVVLAAGEIPHEIAPVHVVELINEEELQVFSESGFCLGLGLERIAVGINVDGCVDRHSAHPDPVGVSLSVESAVDAREEHVELRRHHVVFLMARHHVFVGHLGRRFCNLRVERGAFGVLGRHVAGVVDLIDNRRIVGLPVEERAFAVLFTVEVRGEREHVVGRILVHGRIRRGAYEQKRIRRIAYENHEDARDHEVENPYGQFLGKEQVASHGEHDDHRNRRAVAYERNA